MLTKSDLLSFRQCARKLWLEKNRAELLPKHAESRRSIDGAKVEEKARQLLGPNAIDLSSRGAGPVEAAESARKALEGTSTPAFEVPFVRDGVYARADALIPDGERFAIRETKASTFPLKGAKDEPGKPKDHYLDDVAIQAWVAESSGVVSGRVELNLLDNQWSYAGDESYHGLFRQLDVTDLVNKRKDEVPIWIAAATSLLRSDIPTLSRGPHCSKPYDCPFDGHCATLEAPPPEAPLTLLPGSAGKALARRLSDEKGYVSLLEPQSEELVGKDRDMYLRMQTAHREKRAILEPGARAVLGAYPYPRYYFDFEGIDLPVPRWAGVRPYQQIPFQWSCHIETAAGDFTHEEFLDLSGSDPSERCAVSLVETFKSSGPIFVYSATYERTRILQLAERLPSHRDALHLVADRLADLLPIVQAHFYSPEMNGSFSLKSVLPVIAPDLDYKELIEVVDGTAAQIVYMQAIFEQLTDDRKAEIDANLRRYCRQDTWAMVEIAHYLEGRQRPTRPLEDE